PLTTFHMESALVWLIAAVQAMPFGARTATGLCCSSTKTEIMHILFEYRLKMVAMSDIFLAQFAPLDTAANKTFGTARMPVLTPIQTCRLSFRQSTQLRKLCLRSPKLLSAFCAAK